MSKTYQVGSLLPEAKKALKELNLRETEEAKAKLHTKVTKTNRVLPGAGKAQRELKENA